MDWMELMALKQGVQLAVIALAGLWVVVAIIKDIMYLKDRAEQRRVEREWIARENSPADHTCKYCKGEEHGSV
jgi:uncharacterized membrane protein YciS (DUF1049 family)